MMVHECLDSQGEIITEDDHGPVTGPDVATCWGCLRQWCDRCDPTPAAQCVFCHGRGYSEHQLVFKDGRYHNGPTQPSGVVIAT